MRKLLIKEERIQRMRSLFVGMFVAAASLIACAEQKTVTAGTTVTVGSSEIASWAGADIDIGEGATLCFSEPDSAATFTGRITGSGNFVANASPGGVVPKVFTMDGDAAAFTGGFFFTNVIARIQKPLAVGDIAGITVYSPYDTGASARSYLWGAKGSDGATYVYRNRLDIHVGAHNGMVIDQRAEAAGDIVHRAGVFNGPGRITGRIETYSTALYLMDEIHVEGKVVAHASGAKILNNGTVVHFGGQTRDVAYFQAFDCTRPVHLTGDNLFGANV